MNTFYIIIYGHAGDTIYARPFIKELVARHPDIQVVVECIKKNLYLLDDLGVKLAVVEQNEAALVSGNIVDKAFEPGVFVFHLHSLLNIGTLLASDYSYRSIVHMYNAFLKGYGLYDRYHIYDRRDMPFNEFPARPHVPHAKAGGVLVENGPVFSDQSDFDLNAPLQEFARLFPELNFYCAAKPGFEADNVFDVSAYNLIELCALGNTCMAFLTKCSGVNAATITEQNKYKPRCFAGVKGWIADVWGWETEENPVIFADDKGEIIAFLSYVAKNREVLPAHIKNMQANPGRYRARLQEYVEDVSFCQFLKSKEDVVNCTNYLSARGCYFEINDKKNWETAYILSGLSDSNYLDVGSGNITLMLNTMKKGIPCEKYVVCSCEPAQKVPVADYIIGDICTGLAFADGFFHNITFLSASKQEMDLKNFIQEAARLLCAGGKLYITFDYWETKTPGQNIFDKADVLNLIDACEANGLALTEPMNWQLGETLEDVSCTMGMLRFRKDYLFP